MTPVSDRSQLKFALGAFAAGLAWGYIRYRRSGRAPLMSVLQALEWFVAYGGAAALLTIVRETVEPPEPDEPTSERVTRFRQVVTERILSSVLTGSNEQISCTAACVSSFASVGSFQAGAHGIVASREYEEMKVDHLRAVGRAFTDATKA